MYSRNIYTKDISVVVLIYNSGYEKIRATLNSIVCQKNVDYEIIFADDGSKEEHMDEIQEFFKDYPYISYQYIRNEKNQGTVLNFYSGVVKAQGKYIKPISPGDFLYDSDTLRTIFDFMEKNHAKVAFGKAVHYYLDNSDKLCCISKISPKLYQDYKNDEYNNKKILTNLLLFNDNILGAALVYDTESLKYYLDKMKKVVKYVEDIVTYLMAVDDIQIYQIDNNIVWYEYGGGVSTSANESWLVQLWKDEMSCLHVASQMSPNNKMIEKGVKLRSTRPIKSKLIKKFVRICMEPKLLIFNIKKIKAKKVDISNVKKECIEQYLEKRR